MRLLRNSRRNVHKGAESSPLAQRDQGVRRRQRTSPRTEREEMVAKFGQFLDHVLGANDSSEAFGAVEVPETPRAKRFTLLRGNSPVTRSASTRANAEASLNSRTPNARVEVHVCIPGRSDECHIVEDTPLQSSPPRLRSAGHATRSYDSGFFSEADHGSTSASRDANPPSMRELHSDPSYDPEASHYETLTAIDKMKREVKLSRDPRLQRGEKPTRTNIGEGSELETMLLTEIAGRLFSNDDWAWTFYHLMCNKMYDEATCITSIMRREFKGIQPRYRRDDLGSACDYCIKEHLPCVRLMVDSKGVRRFSVAALPRELKLAYANEKNLGYYVLTSGSRR